MLTDAEEVLRETYLHLVEELRAIELQRQRLEEQQLVRRENLQKTN